MSAGAGFALHPRLEADTLQVLDLSLCRVRLMNDREAPWLILVPMRPGVTELHHLPEPERATLMEEIALASRVLEALHHPGKLNVGALGNLVPQLHLHVIARNVGDRAWPGPIWGTGPVTPYDPADLTRILEAYREALAEA